MDFIIQRYGSGTTIGFKKWNECYRYLNALEDKESVRFTVLSDECKVLLDCIGTTGNIGRN